MAGHRRLRPLGGLALLAAAAWLAAVAVVGGQPTASAAGWTGGIDLYRSGSFTTQQSWLWCTAADVQIIRNIVRGERDHSASRQRTYFDYMRRHNRYSIPVSDGVDPAGWTAGLRHYVDARYRMVTSGSFDAALRSAVTNLRKTNRPVGLLVSHGNHAWILTGFTATADPARTARFTVTSVRVTGPLWGLQSRSYGYDMKPDTKLTPRQLRGFFTPWHYAGVRMAWEGRWVSIQAIPAAAPKASAPTPTPAPRASPSVAPSLPSIAPSAVPSRSAAVPSPVEVAVASALPASPDPTMSSVAPALDSSASTAAAIDGRSILLVGLGALVIGGALRFVRLRRRT
jgi:hypothetical protein